MRKVDEKWVERMKRECAHIKVLPFEEIKALPEAGEFDGGIYFLWKGDTLQYIGKSMHVGERLTHHDWAFTYAKFRSNKTNPIPYDRHTCLVMCGGRIKEGDWIKPILRDHERAYIAHFKPPYNYVARNPGT